MPGFYLFQSQPGTLTVPCPHTDRFRPVASKWPIEIYSHLEPFIRLLESAGVLVRVVSSGGQIPSWLCAAISASALSSSPCACPVIIHPLHAVRIQVVTRQWASSEVKALRGDGAMTRRDERC